GWSFNSTCEGLAVWSHRQETALCCLRGMGRLVGQLGVQRPRGILARQTSRQCHPRTVNPSPGAALKNLEKKLAHEDEFKIADRARAWKNKILMRGSRGACHCGARHGLTHECRDLARQGLAHSHTGKPGHVVRTARRAPGAVGGEGNESVPRR